MIESPCAVCGLALQASWCKPGDCAMLPGMVNYIVYWLRTRNGGQLGGALGSMTDEDGQLMREELALILTHKGKPPNWVR